MQHLRGSLPGDSPPSIYPLLHESTPLSKLPSIVSLAVAAVLLAGCSTATEEPDVRSAATESASSSATPTEEETATPEPEDTQSEEPAEPSPQPSPEPSAEPIVETPVEPAPDLEPLPAGPNDPFVPPPHGEPNPMTGNPYPDVPPGSPHQGDPNDEDARSVAHPQPGYPGPGIVVTRGVLRIGGSGYAPGEEIHILFAEPNTDYNLLSPGGGWPQTPVVAYPGPDGSYTFDIHTDQLAPGEYGVMTWVPERGRETPGAGEASKRFLEVTLVE